MNSKEAIEHAIQRADNSIANFVVLKGEKDFCYIQELEDTDPEDIEFIIFCTL